ncbi:MAG: autotransporter outer membrane beta-barrel domain-containing protein, partial [Salinisphaera sp.]|nr:autotransporter outer membrane beta-barrel domain-containing protein [Salinisphaera sp.]
MRRGPIAWIAGVALVPVCAVAQTDNSFDVTVVANPSQHQGVVLGVSAEATTTLQLRSLYRYIRDTRLSEQGGDETAGLAAISAPGFAALVAAGTGTDSGAAAAFGHWNSFASVTYRFGDHDGSANTPEHDFDRYAFLAGADYRINPDLVVGVSAGYQDNKDEFTDLAGRVDLQGWSLSGYGSWYPISAWYVEGIVRAGFSDYDTRRPLLGAGGGTARGDTEGEEYSASASSGYIFSRGAWTLTPALQLDYTDVNIDGYEEDAPANGLLYEDQDVDSFKSDLGATATLAINTGF